MSKDSLMLLFKKNKCEKPVYRDRYEGQLNDFLVENKNLKEQVTTLQDVEGQLTAAREESARAASSSTELTSALTAAQADAAAQGAARQGLQADLAR